jgi:hypothetical protein
VEVRLLTREERLRQTYAKSYDKVYCDKNSINYGNFYLTSFHFDSCVVHGVIHKSLLNEFVENMKQGFFYGGLLNVIIIEEKLFLNPFRQKGAEFITLLEDAIEANVDPGIVALIAPPNG